MNRAFRWMHKWLGLLLAVQFVLWMASGLAMSLLDHDAVQGHAHRAEKKPNMPAWPRGLLSPDQVIAASALPVQSIETAWLLDRPVYRLTTNQGLHVVSAVDGAAMELDEAAAKRIATSDYVGDGIAQPGVRLAIPNTEARGHVGPVWRFDFSDANDTTVYVSAVDGRVLAHRNRTWRWFDVAWMLHIMDYGKREDFNNPLVIMAAGGGVWIALTGLWLLLSGLRWRSRPAAARAPVPSE
jgi:Na+-transporting NADH:ubiquinone oxidoreductase subunit F